jgi:hypothetical protein
MRAVPETLQALTTGAVDADDLADALLADDDGVDAFLADPPPRAVRRILHDQLFDLLAALDDRRLPAARWLALARHDARRFAWAVPPDAVLPVDDEAVRNELQALLRGHLAAADGVDGLPWLLHPDAFADGEARALLEQRLTGGWAPRLTVIDAMIDRGQVWPAATWLRRSVQELDVDSGSAGLVEARARRAASAGLLLELSARRPWADDPARLRAVAAGAGEDELRQLVRGRAERFDAPADAFARLQVVAWAELATRPSAAAREACAAALAAEPDGASARAAALDVVLALQRVHGAAAVPDLVAAYLAGLHRQPAGDVVLRLLREHRRDALAAALDELPDWQPRYEPLAMERLTYELVPRLGPADREAVAELAELAGGDRGRLVLDELG